MAPTPSDLLGLLATVALLLTPASGARKLFTGSWAVELSGGDAAADALAARHGLVNHGQVSKVTRRAVVWGRGSKLIIINNVCSGDVYRDHLQYPRQAIPIQDSLGTSPPIKSEIAYSDLIGGLVPRLIQDG